LPTTDPAADNEPQPLPPALLQGGQGGRFPVPDPTTLTTEALRREVASLQVLIEQRVAALKELVESKFKGVGVELDLRQEGRSTEISYIKAQIDDDVRGLRDLVTEKFKTVDLAFDLVERQRIEQKKDTKDAVDAALTAQKEAVREQTTASERAIAKSEAATNKQLEQQLLTSGTANEALRRAIDEVKERVADVDRNARSNIADLDRSLRTSLSEVAQTANSYGQQRQGGIDSRAVIGWVLGAVGSLLAIGAIIFAAASRGGG